MVSAADFEQLLALLRAFIRREVMPAEAPSTSPTRYRAA